MKPSGKQIAAIKAKNQPDDQDDLGAQVAKKGKAGVIMDAVAKQAQKPKKKKPAPVPADDMDEDDVPPMKK